MRATVIVIVCGTICMVWTLEVRLAWRCIGSGGRWEVVEVETRRDLDDVILLCRALSRCLRDSPSDCTVRFSARA